MDFDLTLDGMAAANQAFAEDLRERQKTAIAVGGEQLKEDLRKLTRGPLGERVAKAWQMELYGMDGRENPACFVYSKAPSIIRGNMTGGTVVPVAGTEYMAIPTSHVPRRRGRGGKGRMSPEEVEAHFNDDLILVPKQGGKLLGYLNLIRGRSRKRPGFRPVTKGRLRQGRQVRLVLMFTFVRTLKQSKTISPEKAFERARRTTERLLREGTR